MWIMPSPSWVAGILHLTHTCSQQVRSGLLDPPKRADAALATYSVSSRRIYFPKRFMNRKRLHIIQSWFVLRSVRWDFGLSSQVDHFKRRPVFALPGDLLQTVGIFRVVILHRC